jgi:tripartite-type tricarboxylate transporter receptor subunit TctC
MQRITRLAALALAAISLLPAAASAQAFPAKPIRIVVPYTPGGPNDLVGRLYAEHLTRKFGSPAIVDNKPGASGTIGGEAVARSAPDGLTLLIAAPSSTTINASLLPNMPFDPVKDFVAVSPLATSMLVVVVNPSLPVKSLKELAELSRSGRKLTFGSAGTGSAGHLAGELFKTMAGADLSHVPYKGGAPAMTDLLGGHIDVMFADSTVAAPHVKAGKIRAIAVTGASRMPALPEVPTAAESGVPGYEVVSWFGVLAPAGTPKETVAILHREAQAMMATPEYRAKLEPLGAEPAPSTSEAFQTLVAKDVEKWAKVIKESGARADR